MLGFRWWPWHRRCSVLLLLPGPPKNDDGGREARDGTCKDARSGKGAWRSFGTDATAIAGQTGGALSRTARDIDGATAAGHDYGAV
ncbi:UNVERIFIED_CONTAM: hypothetical protein K2H54_043274 [Gekko kuhli]